MHINDAFPSRYIRAADLKGQDVTVTIKSVTIEDLGGQGDPDDTKPVVYFEGHQRGLGLNKTNAQSIAMIAGDGEMDNWIGTELTLYTDVTRNPSGQMVPCIRIRVKPEHLGGVVVRDVAPQPQPQPAAAEADQPQPEAANNGGVRF